MIYSFLALVTVLLFYRALSQFVVDPYIYGWPASSFFYPLSFPVALMDIGFASGIAIVLKLLRQQDMRNKAEQLLIREKLETEIKYLRNQMNPHFLFNTLNNIYGLARKKDDGAADAVMKLSKLLRFMLYETEKEMISIADEIKLLEDYIDLEKIRYNNKLTVQFCKKINDEHAAISPLLLLPFVENAFKHGVSESRFSSSIDIVMVLKNGILNFTVKNTKESNDQLDSNTTIGLTNVKRQLELLYTDYDLKITNGSTLFSMELTINLNSYAKNKLSYR